MTERFGETVRSRFAADGVKLNRAVFDPLSTPDCAVFSANTAAFHHKGGGRKLLPTDMYICAILRSILRLVYAAVTVLNAYRGENRRQVEKSMLAAAVAPTLSTQERAIRK